MKLLLSLWLVCLVSGCGAGSGLGLDELGQPIVEQPVPEPTPDPQGLQPTLASIQENVLTPICTQCHAGNNAPLGLRMDDLDTSITNLIDVDSVTNSHFKLVNPGNADTSFLFMKVIGDPLAGNQMPLGQAPLPAETIAVLRSWIESGAPVDTNQVFISTAEAKASASDFVLNLRFSLPIDINSIQANEIQILTFDGSGKWASNNANIKLQWTNPQQLKININQPDKLTKRLRLSFNDSATSSLFSTKGVLLDGDHDGIPGGEYHYEQQF